MRFFNTAGPVDPEMHYCVPPLERLDVDELLLLIRHRKYFVLHAPRQTGKTSALLALRDALNAEDEFRCAYVNVEGGQSAREDVGAALRAILSALARSARETLDDRFVAEVWPDILETAGPHDALRETLARWSESSPRPLVLMIDEVDALVGDTLIAVLRQLRAGYPERPSRFPQSVVLCGVRDVRDYRIRSATENAVIAGGSAFNVRAESLRLGDLSPDEVQFLLAQHTSETGQVFTSDARAAVWELTRGQPWLVNALAFEACFKNRAGRDHDRAVSADAIQDAREALILRRDTHLDQLADKLREERVRRVVEPLLSGAEATDSIAPDDLQYVRDLGLIAASGPVAITNPIYREVIPRDLTWTTQEMSIHHDPTWYIGDDGALRVDELLAAFQEFFREHSEHWVERFQYKEAGPQLLLQAFLQRVCKRRPCRPGGGRIEREYGLGRMRTDLLLLWPMHGAGAKTQAEARHAPPRQHQKVVIECKVLRRGIDRTVREGLEQTSAYMDRCGAADGHLVVFDRTEGKPWSDKLFRREEKQRGVSITVWGM